MNSSNQSQNQNQISIPRLVIGAPRSGSGKTLITIALIKALLQKGSRVTAFKCGPDYIDPMFHQKVLEVPSTNLDLFFTSPEVTRRLFVEAAKPAAAAGGLHCLESAVPGEDRFEAAGNVHISIIEGVMGLYDGIGGTTSAASTYHLAQVLSAPIIFVLDAKGMGGPSIIAELSGFLGMDSQHLIKGVIFNNMVSSIFDALKPQLEQIFPSLQFPGFFPPQKQLQLDSRHLGLKLPSEVRDLSQKVQLAADSLSQTVNLEQLLQLAASAAPFSPAVIHDFLNEGEKNPATVVMQTVSLQSSSGQSSTGAAAGTASPAAPAHHFVSPHSTIAVARDEAFCFYYQENLNLLKKYGAQLVEFSPLHDSFLPPDADGILLGGGYPELFAKQLSENKSMISSIYKAVSGGIPCLAECGGFMYLHKNLYTQEGECYKMCGAIDGDVKYTGKLVRFGYVELKEKVPKFLNGGTSCGTVRGHEFHYFDSTANGEDCVAEKPVSKKTWNCSYVSKNSWLGFAHLYYQSNPDFARNFVERCIEYGKNRK